MNYIWIVVTTVLAAILIGLNFQWLQGTWVQFRHPKVLTSLDLTEQWIGKSVTYTHVPQLASSVYLKKPFYILFIPNCPVCELGPSYFPSGSPPVLDQKLFLITDLPEVKEMYRAPFTVDKSQWFLPAEWYGSGSLLIYIDQSGIVKSIICGKKDIEARLSLTSSKSKGSHKGLFSSSPLHGTKLKTTTKTLIS